jgi:methylated-DNA-[protein]-cysteine S-methyltransferase
MQQGIQFNSPIGLVTLISHGDKISCVRIGDNIAFSKDQLAKTELLNRCRQQFEEYFAAQRKEFDLPIPWEIFSGFQAEVLPIIHKIPYGEVRTYGDIARELGNPAASRAVGKALAQNPLPILIPCHRVVAASGHLTGFSAADGITSKTWLLQLEGHRVVAEKLA